MDSAVFALPEGKMLSYFNIVPEDSFFDVPNGVIGLVYYLFSVTRESLVAKENLFWNKVQIFASSLSMMSSIFLAIRLAQLKELCVVCLSSHVINTSLFVIFFSRITAAKQKRY